jgi:hypothetical protein
MTRRKWTILAIVLTAFLATFWAVSARHRTPAGQPPLANVTEQSLAQVKAEFNASADSERVLLLLSPTCPVCVKGSSVVNAVLKRNPADKIRVITIWEPMLPTDWNRPTSAVLDLLSDRRVVQWWDQEHIVAGLVKQSLAGQNPGCCWRHDTLWDVVAVYPPGAKWTETLPAPKFFGGPVVRGAPQWEAQLRMLSEPLPSGGVTGKCGAPSLL